MAGGAAPFPQRLSRALGSTSRLSQLLSRISDSSPSIPSPAVPVFSSSVAADSSGALQKYADETGELATSVTSRERVSCQQQQPQRVLAVVKHLADRSAPRSRWCANGGVGGLLLRGWAEEQRMGRGWAEQRRYLHRISVEEEKPEHKFRVKATVEGGFTFTSDLAPTDGVGGTAPTPMDYAAAAVAMCTATTVRLYADRKQWPLTYIAVTVEPTTPLPHGRLPEGLRLLIRLEGPLSAEQKQKLLEIAGKCPVKQMMLGKMPQAITTMVYDPHLSSVSCE